MKTVIIGSGITGLCLGALLAKYGHRVTVLEAHPTLIGGHARSITLNGLEFSPGPQYVWNFGENEGGNTVLRHLGLEKDNPFDLMDSHAFEILQVGQSDRIQIPMGLDRYCSAIVEQLPTEKENIEKFFGYLKHFYEAGRYILQKGLYLRGIPIMISSVLAATRLPLTVKLQTAKYGWSSLGDMFDHCKLSPRARRLLYGHGGIFAEDESSISIGVYAATTGHYHAGASYPRFGFSKLVDNLAAAIKQHGDVLTNKRVISATVDGNVARYVTCEDGTQWGCDVLVSNLSPRLTCNLFSACKPERFAYEPSNALSACFIGLRKSRSISEVLKGRNLWWQDGKGAVEYRNPDMNTMPSMLYVGSNTAKEYGKNADDDMDSLTLFAPGSFRQSKHYFEQGEDAYFEFKERVKSNLLQCVEDQLFTDIQPHIEFAELYTPYDTFLEIGAEQGSGYGRRPDVKTLMAAPHKLKGVENLFIACATIGLPGVATCFQTACKIYSDITGERIHA